MRELCLLATVLLTAVATLAGPVQRQADEAGTIYRGAVADLDWGRPLAAGDLDGDGYDEVLVGASESYGGYISRVYVLRGGPGAHGRGVVDLAVGGVEQVILGAAVDDNLGSSIGTGDMNGDGIDDLLICASNADFGGVESCGIAYLIFGGHHFFDLATRDLADGANWDMRIIGPVAGGDMGGSNLFGGLDAHSAAIGYINDDAYGDIILGVHLANGAATQSGRVYVLFGADYPSGFTFNLAVAGNYDIRIDGRSSYDELGTVVLTGDLTGDGIEELILPNQYYSLGFFTSEGAVHIYRGRAAWASFYSLGSGVADLTLRGARAQDELGAAAAVGDFNHDGLTDLAVAATGADAGALNTQRGDGFVYGLLGATAYQTGTWLINYATATPDFWLIGESEENLGMQVSVGDFNADGFDDIAAGEWFAGPATNGAVEVLFGRNFVPGAVFTANVDTDLRILGAPQDRISFSLAAADVNGDGMDEILFGTPFNNSDRGTAYVFTQVSGDTDHDGDVDLADFAVLQACVNGQSGNLAAGCLQTDFDLDENVDFVDFTALVPLWSGPRL